MNSYFWPAFSLILLLPYSSELSAQGASITEETRSILTYPYSDPNPIPSLALNSMVRPFYPYFVFDGYTDRSEQKEWNVISMDNEYITITVLPEVGGKVWGAIEKSTGREFIYQNHVMKFRAIGIRGPWTSGGIEHNFGLDLGHAPWTSSAVDYIIRNEPDGSISCIVGGLDLASRTQWRVNIRLPAGKAFFETSSMWYNPTPLHDAYLSWENAAYKATDDLQFYFPGNFYIGHDGSVHPWPLDNMGRKLDLYRENNFGTSKSYHVSGYLSTWYGGYWHDSEFGSGHWTPYSDAPGKKIWIWSLARDGAIWEDLLTDNDGQYIEAQSGVKFNQANRESGYNSPYNQLSMRPYYTETKKEYWFPVIETGGMVAASDAGTMNVTRLDHSLKISVSPIIPLHDSLKIFANGKLVYTIPVHQNPLQLFEQTVGSNDINEDSKIIVTLGNNLLSYNSDSEDIILDRPNKSVSETDYKSAEHLFYLGEDMNAMRDYPEALKCYLECLEKEPTHTRALYRIAELYYRKVQYQEAQEYARQALEINTYDPGANFIYGMIQRKLGNLIRAEEAFSIAARSMEFRSGSYLQIAELNLLEKDYKSVTDYAQKALDFNRYNIPAWECLTTAYRKMNDMNEFATAINELLKIDPLDHYARFEEYLINPSENNLNSFKSLIRNELPYETYLELAVTYVNRGLHDEAEKVLLNAPSNPVIYYWLAYLNRVSSTEKCIAYLEKAVEISPFLVFPFRLETIPVLEWAVQQNDSWKTKYYLALVYWNLNRYEKAAEWFEQCGDLPDWAAFYMVRALFSQKSDINKSSVFNDLKRAQTIGPGEWRTWHYLSSYYEAGGSFNDHLKTSGEAYHRFPGNPVIGIDYAKALIQSSSYKECLGLLKNINILPQEGAHEGHDLFELANLSLALQLIKQKKYKEAIKYIENSRTWPENLGAGRPFDPDERLQDLLSVYCYRQTGNNQMVRECHQNIIEYSRKKWGGDYNPANIIISNMVFRENSLVSEADLAMEKWMAAQDSLRNWSISAGSGSPWVQWVIAKYWQNEKEVKRIEATISALPGENRFRLLLETLNLIGSEDEKK